MINIYQGQIEIAHCNDRVWGKLGYRLSKESAKNDIKKKEKELKKNSDVVIMDTRVVKMRVYK
jgi:hypothetical protein